MQNVQIYSRNFSLESLLFSISIKPGFGKLVAFPPTEKKIFKMQAIAHALVVKLEKNLNVTKHSVTVFVGIWLL